MPRNTAQQLYDVSYVVYGGERGEVGRGRKGMGNGDARKREGKEERGEDVHKGERTQRLYREVRIENRERKVTCS